MKNMPVNSVPADTDSEESQRTIREKLLLREAQLSQAQRMAGMASWEWYFGDTQIRWSPEMYLFWGYEPGEIEVDLDSVAQTTHVDDLPILQSAIGRALNGEDLEMEYRRYDKQGREIFIHTIGRIIHNEKGEPLGVFGIDMNITARKQQELHLEQLNRQLAEKNRELEKRNAELSAFSFAASHDLQEPLRKIRMFNSLILEREANRLSTEGQSYFNRSMQSAERMQALIKNLAAYARTNLVVRPRQLVDLNELLTQLQNQLEEPIGQQQATLITDTLPVVSVVEFMFGQLLQNLLRNALTYTRPDVKPVIQITYSKVSSGEVPVEAAIKSATCHRLTVADNGMGFDPVYNQKIFGLFQRLNSTGDTPTGTGTGLALCQRIMDHHGGIITADGQPGAGATFTLYWPADETAT